MRVGLLTQWYDPEPGPAALPGVLAKGLRSRGHEVQVVTGFPNYPTGRVGFGYSMTPRLDEDLDGVQVRRVALYPSHDASVWGRMANYASFAASASVNGIGALRQCDAVWVNYSPITIAGPMWLARAALRVPVITHVLDLWPDTVLASGLSGGGRVFENAAKPLHAWCRGMYAASTAVAYISPGVGAVLRARGVAADKLHYVPMWADEDVFRPADPGRRDDLGLAPDQVVLLYAGALGEAQGLRALIEACARVDRPEFVCLIAGSGTAEEGLRRRAAELGATNVRFLGRVPQSAMTRLMAAADASYVGLRPHALSPVTMPSKTQAALAAAKAVLVAADGDVAAVVAEAGAGFTAPAGDVTAVADRIEQACGLGRAGLRRLGERGRRYYEANFSVAEGVSRIEALLAQAAATKVRSGKAAR